MWTKKEKMKKLLIIFFITPTLSISSGEKKIDSDIKTGQTTILEKSNSPSYKKPHIPLNLHKNIFFNIFVL